MVGGMGRHHHAPPLSGVPPGSVSHLSTRHLCAERTPPRRAAESGVMRHFQLIAQNIDVLPLLLDLYRQPSLWDQHDARTNHEGAFTGTSDIWLRFRAQHELREPEDYVDPFTPVFYPAWDRLPHARPIVFGLMARCEAVQLGGVMVTRVPPGQSVKPHRDLDRWHASFFNLKVYIPLTTNPSVVSTCGDEVCVMAPGSAWSFPNDLVHSTVNDGDTDRITLITCLRVE